MVSIERFGRQVGRLRQQFGHEARCRRWRRLGRRQSARRGAARCQSGSLLDAAANGAYAHTAATGGGGGGGCSGRAARAEPQGWRARRGTITGRGRRADHGRRSARHGGRHGRRGDSGGLLQVLLGKLLLGKLLLLRFGRLLLPRRPIVQQRGCCGRRRCSPCQRGTRAGAGRHARRCGCSVGRGGGRRRAAGSGHGSGWCRRRSRCAGGCSGRRRRTGRRAGRRLAEARRLRGPRMVSWSREEIRSCVGRLPSVFRLRRRTPTAQQRPPDPAAWVRRPSVVPGAGRGRSHSLPNHSGRSRSASSRLTGLYSSYPCAVAGAKEASGGSSISFDGNPRRAPNKRTRNHRGIDAQVGKKASLRRRLRSRSPHRHAQVEHG